MAFHEKLKAVRVERGLSQEQLAEKLNVSRQAVTKWECGNGMPDIDNLKMIAQEFCMTVDELLGEGSCRLPQPQPTEGGIRYAFPVNHTLAFAFHISAAASVTVSAAEGKEVSISLSAPEPMELNKSMKVLGVEKGRGLSEEAQELDITVKGKKVFGAAKAMEQLNVRITVPRQYVKNMDMKAKTGELILENVPYEHFEFDGAAQAIQVKQCDGVFVANLFTGTEITMNSMPQRVEINEIRCETVLRLPRGEAYRCENKGRGCELLAEHGEAEGAVIELNGLNGKLTVLEGAADE